MRQRRRRLQHSFPASPQRLATLLRHEVRKVVAQDDEVDDELRHLLRLLAG